jgi:serine protease Do
MATDGFAPPPPQQPAMPSEQGRADHDALPDPPAPDDLAHMAPHIRAAILANVFLLARDGEQRWNGSGIIIARDGDRLAILTNRHVVESDDARRLCAMKAMTVSGEAIEVSAVWRARRGIDLALVEGQVRRPERVGVMPLGSGAVLVGAEVFAIGNPLGLAWSYTAGTLSATRHWTTRDGLSVRILQTDANIAPGSSGGGLFHRDGHLLGIMSFLRQGHAGGSAHFALSVTAIRDAFAREDVRWRGQALAELPP